MIPNRPPTYDKTLSNFPNFLYNTLFVVVDMIKDSTKSDSEFCL
jgi:hypothetical protein